MFSSFPLRVTREGFFFISLTLLFGVSAVNTGFNLLYLLFSMMLALIILSGILTTQNLRNLEVQRQVVPFTFPKGELEVELILTNKKKIWPSFSLTLEEKKLAQGLEPKPVYFPFLPAGATGRSSYPLHPTRRGRISFSALVIITSFPFGLFRKQKKLSLSSGLMVYPSLYDLKENLPPGGGTSYSSSTAREVLQGDFHTLREYRPGDSIHSIHWKSSARQGHMMVQKHHPPFPEKLFLILGIPSSPEGEKLLSLTASLALYFLNQNVEVGLHTEGKEGIHHLLPLSGREQAHKILRTLALLELNDTIPYQFLQQPIFFAQGIQKIGIFTALPQSAIPFDQVMDSGDADRLLNTQQRIFDSYL